MEFPALNKVFILITIIGTIVAATLGCISLYEKIFPGDEFMIEQRLSPEMMEELKKGDGTITIEKGITIRRGDDARSTSD